MSETQPLSTRPRVLVIPSIEMRNEAWSGDRPLASPN